MVTLPSAAAPSACARTMAGANTPAADRAETAPKARRVSKGRVMKIRENQWKQQCCIATIVPQSPQTRIRGNPCGFLRTRVKRNWSPTGSPPKEWRQPLFKGQAGKDQREPTNRKPKMTKKTTTHTT